MSRLAFGKGQCVKIGTNEFLMLQRLPENNWQLQDTATGEWFKFTRTIFSIGTLRRSCLSSCEAVAAIRLVRNSRKN